MTPAPRSLAALVVCLLCCSTTTSAKPLTQGLDLTSSDRLYYFGGTEEQDFELVSPQIDSPAESDEVQVVFEAFGQAFLLSLRPAVGLFDAGTLVHEVGKNGKIVLSQPTESCLYEGSSSKHQDSAVKASNCANKLEASVATKDGSYVLAPLKAEHVDVDGPTHMVFRRSVNTKACNLNAERSTVITQARRKRSTMNPVYVEASIVADELMYKTYGDQTNNYLITIMNQVAGLLKDSSLDVQVNLKISNIKIIKSPQEDLPLSENLDRSLKSFCSWQRESKSDISILVTRRDLISAGSHEVTGKTADIGGACNPDKRCLISQDHGPSGLIFTLAHEIGHSLGMYHDGGLSDCLNKKNIMATVNSGGPDAFHWSQCSSSDLLNFLDRPESKCLKNKPKSLPAYTPSSVPMPGFYYNATQQCAMSFNAKSTVAPEVLNQKEICQALVCQTGEGVSESTRIPPLDGTRCGTKRDICISGECMKVYSTLDCDGGECIPFWLASTFVCNTATCIQSRTVLCVEQHDDGTTRRVNDLSRCPTEIPPSTAVCNSDPCRFKYLAGEYSACSVTCGQGVQTRDVLCQDTSLEGIEVVSDTFCQDVKPTSVAQCDTGVLCPSTGFVVGQYGDCSATCGIGIQTRDVFCQDSQGNRLDDIVCITLNQVKPETTQACNDGDCPNQGLRYIPGPLTVCSVTCGSGIRTRMIYCVNGANFVVQNSQCEAANLQLPSTQTTCEESPCQVVTYTAVRGQYTACPVTCGVGVETRVVICLDQNNEEVDIQNCIEFGLTDLETSRTCTLSDCPPEFSFQPTAYGECSVTCGSGIRTRDVPCVSVGGDVVEVINCLNLGLTAPPNAVACELEECATYLYRFEPFGPCSVECGEGVQIRTVICINNDTSELVDDSNCSGERPASTQPCSLEPCSVILQFVSGAFTSCNCSGLQTRPVFCISSSGTSLNSVPLQNCLDDGLVLPVSIQQCTPPSGCVQVDPVWESSPWGACSVTCDIGIQTRLVYCIEAQDSPVIVDDNLCNADDIPDTTQVCDTQVSCPANNVWLAYDWGTCSVTCGGGVEMRTVQCFSLGASIVPVNDSQCLEEKPVDIRACNPEPCTASWTTSDWSPCSVSCGVGTESRTVVCRATKDQASNEVAEDECITENRPAESRNCLLDICPSPFGCDTTSVLEENVQYIETSPGFTNGLNYPNDLDCDKAYAAMVQDAGRVRRETNMTVRADQYIQLTFTAFDLEASSDCSYDYVEITDIMYSTSERLCGNSYELPLMWTSQGPHISIRFHTDASINRPGYRVIYTAIQRQEPAVYRALPWSECSVTCGEGVQTREIVCYRGEDIVDEMECSGLERPLATQDCEEEQCLQPSSCSGDLLRTEDGTILLSPNFPDSYPSNVSCINNIQAPLGMVVQISITFFNLRPSENCEDSVLINDVNAEGDGLELCGSQPIGVIFTSITNEVSVQFVSGDEGEFDTNSYSLQANFVNEQGTPCGREIRTSGQSVYSPNYPLDYSSDEKNCLTVIRNTDGCIQLQFLDMDLPPYDESGQCSAFVQVVDLTLVNVNTGPICGNTIPTVFYSATSLLTVRFFSDEAANTTGGYNAVVRFVECTAGLWITGPFGGCSATCGEAVRSRTVACQDPRTMEELDPNQCPPERPEELLPCETVECPSCDATILESGVTITSPDYPEDYGNDLSCVTDIYNPDGCVSISFTAFTLQSPILSEMCNTDFVKIDDGMSEAFYCGPRGIFRYESASGSVRLMFVSDQAVAAPGYTAFVSFIPCPVNSYVIGNWSACSVTCGSGIRTRDVDCVDQLTGMPAEDSLCGNRPASEEPCEAEVECQSCDVVVNETNTYTTSPGFPNVYTPNLDCEFTFEHPAGQCLRLTFLEMYLGGTDESGICTGDRVEIEGSNGQAPTILCPESARSLTWYSRTSSATMRYITDDDTPTDGFVVFNLLSDCPEYDWNVGEFAPCDRACGGGTQSRQVRCFLLRLNFAVLTSFCNNPRPASEAPCNLDPCPVCDMDISPESPALFTSPGFYDNVPSYTGDLDCTYNITNPDGCIQLTLLDFQLQQCDECECDSVTMFERGEVSFGPLCGMQPVRRYDSDTGNVLVKFVTDNTIEDRGFNIHVAYVDCPDAYYFTGEFSECDVSCGGGVQTREVYCASRATGGELLEAMCGSRKPPSTRACGEEPCPFCDEEITSIDFISSPNYMEEYPININCNYNIFAPDDMCVSVVILSLDLEEPSGDPPMCKDFVELTDASYPVLRRRYCTPAENGNIEWKSRSSNATVEFYSDEENVGTGFRAYVTFIACPTYGFEATEFGVCSRQCGGGVQTRDVLCKSLINGELAPSEEDCTDERPADSRPCNTQPCPVCDAVIVENRQTVESLNFPQPYFEYNCSYVYSNPGGCVELIFVQFEMPQPYGFGNCISDYLLVEDLSANQFSYRICGSSPDPLISRGPTLNVTLVTDGNVATFGQGFQLYNLFTSNCPLTGYLAGPWEECDRECGGGTRQRSVDCVDLDTGTVIDEVSCSDRKPHDTELCNSQDCPSCDMFINTFPYALQSPEVLEPQRTCRYNISSASCVRLTFLSFDFPETDMRCGDTFLRVDDLGAGYLRRTFCGTGPEIDPATLLYAWESRTGQVMATLNTGEVIPAGSSFNIYITETDCPAYGFVSGNFSECSSTCGDDGIRERTVECQVLDTGDVADSEDLCTDPKPETVVPCRPQEPCPSCDTFVEEQETMILSPPKDGTWTTDVRCTISINLPDEYPCMIIAGLSLIFPEPDENGTCVESSLTFTDLTYNQTVVFCGTATTLPTNFRLLSNSATVQFYAADYLASGADYILYVLGSACPTLRYEVGEFSECSASCGGGVQTRDVACKRMDTDEEVPLSACDLPLPEATVPCNTGDCPMECDTVLTSNNPSVTLTSPGLPTYVPNADCSNRIVSLIGCVSINVTSLDIEEGSQPGVCDKDYLEIFDASHPELTVRLCGSTPPATVWRSVAGVVGTTFVSDDVDTDQTGFSLEYYFQTDCPTGTFTWIDFGECSASCGGGVRTAGDLQCVLPNNENGTLSDCPGLPPSLEQPCNEVPCPEYYYYTGPYSSCSKSCGNGVLTRLVECRRVDNDTVADASQCEGTAPSEMSPCNVGACPSAVIECDNVLFDADQMDLLVAPGRPSYVVNASCVNGIVNLQGCVSINVTSLDIEEGSQPGVCDKDYLEISDILNPALTVRLCGTTVPPTVWRSLGGNVRITFVSDDVDTAQAGYTLEYTFESECPTGEYLRSSWGMCSASCGGGVRTAGDLQCVLPNNENGTLSDCPGLPPSLEQPCNEDPCPEYYYYTGPYSTCSTSCGNGVLTRLVECRRVDNDTVADASQCEGTAPSEMSPCNLNDCPSSIVECDNVLFDADQMDLLVAPGRPSYVVNASCVNGIVNLQGCVNINVTSLDIEEGSQPGVCDKDYLEISDILNPALTVRLCGTTVPPTVWRSLGGNVRITFVSDDVDTAQAGYTLEYTFESECPTGEYLRSSWGMCSASCGGGVRTAGDLQCVLPNNENGTLSDCPGLPPSLEQPCNEDPCPLYEFVQGAYSNCSVDCGMGVETSVEECRTIANNTLVAVGLCDGEPTTLNRSCDAGICANAPIVVDDSGTVYNLELGSTGKVSSPNYPMQYPNNLNGQVTLNFPVGNMLQLTIDSLSLPTSDPCTDGDYLTISDGTQTLELCSDSLGVPFTWYSIRGATQVTLSFVSSPIISDAGFSATYTVIENIN